MRSTEEQRRQVVAEPLVARVGGCTPAPLPSDLGDLTLRFDYHPDPQPVMVTSEGAQDSEIMYSFWFAWHAMYPQDVLR